MLKEAGFNDEAEFAKEINTPLKTIKYWIQSSRFPSYVDILLKFAIKAKQCENLEKQVKNPEERESINRENKVLKLKLLHLQNENKELAEKIKGFKELKKLYAEL